MRSHDDRTFLNRTIDQMEATMDNHGLSSEEIETYSEPIDTSEIQAELDGISIKISKYNDIKFKTDGYKHESVSLSERIVENGIQLKELEAKIKELETKIISINQYNERLEEGFRFHEDKYNKGLAWLEKNTEPSASEVSKRLNEASIHNENHNKVKALVEKQKELHANKNKLSKLNDDIESIDSKKSKLIKNSKLPVKGLSFSEDEIFLNGLPMEEHQINTAKLIDIGTDISMALNPNLRVIFLHEGSLFDKESLEALIKKVEERGYQLICECVTNEKDLSITFTESDE